MKRILFIITLFIILTDTTFGLSLSPQIFEGEEITISGNDFGSSGGLYGKICINDICYSSYSSKITYWSYNKIKIKMPVGIPNIGKISVYATDDTSDCYYGSCYKSEKFIGNVQYNINPKILEVSTDGKYISTIGNPGGYLLINGIGLGDRKGKVKFGREYSEIISWSDSLIEIHLPKIPNGSDDIIIISSNGKKSISYSFTLRPYISDDLYSSHQYYLKETGVTDVWNNKKFPKRGEGITVAIIDSGLNHNNLDIKHSIWTNTKEIPNNGIDDDNNGYIDDIHGWNFVRNDNLMDITDSHGTMVAGIIAGKINNGIGIAGIAEKTTIMPLIVFHQRKGGEDNQIINAIKYATDNGANIINLSLGGALTTSYGEEYDNIIKYAYEEGVVIVVASGNGDYTKTGTSRDLDIYKSSPVCNDGGEGNNYIIGVSATDKDRIKAGFADYGKECIDISAPGVNIASISHKAFSSNGLEYDIANGTSFSTPIVVGAISLLWSNRPYLDNEDIYELLLSTGDDLDKKNPNYKGKLGKFLNTKKLLNMEGDFSDIKIKSIGNDVTFDSGKYIYFKGENFSKRMYLHIQRTNIKTQIEGNFINKNNIYFDISELEEKYHKKSINFKIFREYGGAYKNKIVIDKMNRSTYISKNLYSKVKISSSNNIEEIYKKQLDKIFLKIKDRNYKYSKEKQVVLYTRILKIIEKHKSTIKDEKKLFIFNYFIELLNKEILN